MPHTQQCGLLCLFVLPLQLAPYAFNCSVAYCGTEAVEGFTNGVTVKTYEARRKREAEHIALASNRQQSQQSIGRPASQGMRTAVYGSRSAHSAALSLCLQAQGLFRLMGRATIVQWWQKGQHAEATISRPATSAT